MVTMTATKAQIKFAREAGHAAALDACRESRTTSTPADGWDGWLVDAGSKAAARTIGLESLDDSEGWPLFIGEELLAAFHRGAVEAAKCFAASEELAELLAEDAAERAEIKGAS